VLERPVVCAAAALAGGLGPGMLCVRAELLDAGFLRAGSVGRFARIKAASHPDAQWLYLPETLSTTRTSATLTETVTLWDEQERALGYGLEGVTTRFEVLDREPSTIVPAQRAQTVTVVIAGDDLDQLTELLKQLATQEVSGKVGVLVVTASDAERIGKLRASAAQLLPESPLEVAECSGALPAPARFNLAAARISSETIVFLSPEARLRSPVALETVTAWALVKDLGMIVAGRSLQTDRPIRGLGGDDALDCLAVSGETWLTVGDFEPSAFPNLYGADWALRAEDLGFVNLFCPQHDGEGPAAGPSDLELEKAMVRALHPGRVSQRETAQALAASVDRADERAAFVLERLMTSRRATLRAQQDLAVEAGNLTGLADDLRQAVSILSLKLDQGSPP
jgi:hypothetical protein